MKLRLHALEPTFRRLLRLPAEPFGDRFYLEPAEEDKPYRRFRSRTSEEWAAEMDRWHADPKAAQIVEQALRLPLAAERAVEGVRGRIVRRRLVRELKQARAIVFDSMYVHVLGETAEVEGFLQAPWWSRDEGIWLTITTPEMVRLQAESAWGDGEVLVEEAGSRAFEHRVIVPAATLSPKLVEQALERWYMASFEWERGHWAVAERTLPKFLTRLHWQQPETEAEQTEAAARIAEAEAAVAAIEEWPSAGRTRALFGR